MPRYCQQCVLPETRPGVRLDEAGVCRGCRSVHDKASVDWNRRAEQFAELAENAKRRGAKYDCVIPVSGGKDGFWQVETCLDHGLHPLCVTYRVPFRNELGQRNLDRLIEGWTEDKTIPNSRYRYHPGEEEASEVKAELMAEDGYLKAAGYLMVDGMFNVNSTSVAAWYSLFAGIRERQLVFRDSSGAVKKIKVPSRKRIALSRFDTEVSDQEMDDAGQGTPERGADLGHGDTRQRHEEGEHRRFAVGLVAHRGSKRVAHRGKERERGDELHQFDRHRVQ